MKNNNEIIEKELELMENNIEIVDFPIENGSLSKKLRRKNKKNKKVKSKEKELTEQEKLEEELDYESNIWDSKVSGYITREVITEEILDSLSKLLLEKQRWFIENKKFIKENLIDFYEFNMRINEEIKEILKKEKLKPKPKISLPEPELIKQKGKRKKD